MNCKILFSILLLVATSCSRGIEKNNLISKADSDKRVRNAIDSVLRNKEFDDKSTGGIGMDTLRSFMRAYRDNPLAIIDMQQEAVKGFFIGDTIISLIKNNLKPINGLYIYFGKKIHPYTNINSQATSVDFNGKYTIIAIPSIPSGTPGKDELLYMESLEWHDPVTNSKHTPINEYVLYTQPQNQ